MTHCDDHEIEISALFDGESDPNMALRLVQHVASCSSCSSFVSDLKSTQAAIDRVRPTPKPKPVVELQQARRWYLGGVPRWAWGMAAGLIVTIGLWFGSGATPSRQLANDMRDGELVIRLGEDEGRMTNERFFSLMSELLRADRHYHTQMYAVLDEITQNGTYGESEYLNTPSESAAPVNSSGSDHYPLSHRVSK